MQPADALALSDPPALAGCTPFFAVWKASGFSRKRPRPPDFQVVVCQYSDSVCLPQLQQAAGLCGPVPLMVCSVDQDGSIVLFDMNFTPASQLPHLSALDDDEE
jgi:hypothetical protein